METTLIQITNILKREFILTGVGVSHKEALYRQVAREILDIVNQKTEFIKDSDLPANNQSL